MHNSKIKRISLAVCLALMPLAAGAAGLGKMTVMSGLGEPLNAEIEIAANKEELSSLSARIAPSETYNDQGIERAGSLSGVRVELGKKPDGTPVLKLVSQQPINDPFLDMLIQVDWPTGRLLREYTALLDPPGYGDRAAAENAPVTSMTQPPAVTAPSKKNTSKSPAQAIRPPSAAPADATDTYVTKRGDTLRNVARHMQQVDDVTLEQMLVGLYRANRDAFMGDNMNQLKVGQIMHAPRPEEVRAINPQDALQEVRVHTSNWNSYRNNLAEAVAQSKPGAADGQAQSSGGKISGPAEDKAAPAPTGPRDVVKLSKSEVIADKTSATGKNAAADEKLRALEEESTSQDKAIAEVNERIAFFEKQIQDMQKLLLVQNQILADLQKGQAPAPAPAGAAVPTPAQPQPQAAAPAQPAPEANKPAAPAAQPKPVEPPPAEEPSLLDRVQEDPMLMGAAGGGLLLIIGGWLMLRRQRKKNLDSFEKGILTSSGLKTDTVFGSTAGGAVNTGETSFLSDFSHRNGAGMIDTSDVDPISEAEVYMAYGRDAQAEEILKDAIVKEPKRYELHQKLLEIYANRKDAVAFETLAGELYATLGTNDPTWNKVAELGRTLEPDNPMYASGTGAASTPAATDSSSSAMPLATAAAVTAAAAAEAMSEQEPEPGEAEAQDNSLDFDLSMLGADEQEDAAAAIEKESEKQAVADFPSLESFSAPEPAAQEIAAEEAENSVSFELPEPAAEESVQLEAADLGLPSLETEADQDVEDLAFDLPAVDTAAPTEEAPAVRDVEIAAPQEAAEETFELPEMQPATAPAQIEEEPSVEEISFDLPELTLPEAEPATAATPELELPETLEPPAASIADTPAPAEEPEVSFELPPVAEVPPSAPETPASALPEIELPEAPDLAALAETAVPKLTTTDVEEIVFEETPAEENKLDFNFDMDIEAEASAEEASAAALPDLDLSGISLDIAEPETTAPATEMEEITLSGSESSDVDTKLDLVTAYMDMGDTEGARELLQEVLQEGGPQQRERAQKMLDSLS